MKYCVNCGNELFDEAVVCPKCNVSQPAVKNAKTYSANKKVLFAVKMVFTTIICSIAIFASVIVGYQLFCVNYICSNFADWKSVFNSNELSYSQLNDFENEVKKYPADKFSVFNSKQISYSLIKDYDNYLNFCDELNFAKNTTKCKMYYDKYHDTKEEIPVTDYNDIKLYFGYVDSYYNNLINSKISVSKGVNFYTKIFENIKPSKDDIVITIIEPVNQELYDFETLDFDVEYKVKNNSIFPIYYYYADFNFKLYYTAFYSEEIEDWAYAYNNNKINLSSCEGVEGQTEKTFEENFDLNDYADYSDWSGYGYRFDISEKCVKVKDVETQYSYGSEI